MVPEDLQCAGSLLAMSQVRGPGRTWHVHSILGTPITMTRLILAVQLSLMQFQKIYGR